MGIPPANFQPHIFTRNMKKSVLYKSYNSFIRHWDLHHVNKCKQYTCRFCTFKSRRYNVKSHINKKHPSSNNINLANIIESFEANDNYVDPEDKLPYREDHKPDSVSRGIGTIKQRLLEISFRVITNKCIYIYTRKFREEWKMNRSWLCYDTKSKSIFCSVCKEANFSNSFTTGCAVLKKENVTYLFIMPGKQRTLKSKRTRKGSSRNELSSYLEVEPESTINQDI
ncbi:hypothetical protein ACF0H5_001332 [Mactra antiquata]